jgi:hypothetical protein
MTRAAAFLLFLCLGCSTAPLPPAAIGFAGSPDGPRLLVNGVRLGDPEAAAVALLGDSGRAGFLGLHEAALAGPGGAQVLVRYTAREGRVDGLWLELEGSLPALMRARNALAKAAMRAGATCGPDGCAAREGEGAFVRVRSVLSWPARVELVEVGHRADPRGARVAALEGGDRAG